MYDQLRGRQLSPESAAKLIDVSISQIHRWISAGEIHVARLGHRCTRIDGGSLADFLIRRSTIQAQPRGKATKAT
jgi:hypothetical protein